jgi:hypothetical protein
MRESQTLRDRKLAGRLWTEDRNLLLYIEICKSLISVNLRPWLTCPESIDDMFFTNHKDL